MLPQDVFRSRLEAAVASLSYWAPTIKDAARVEMSDEPSAWRMTVTPHLATACALELVIRADQLYDITIGGETYTGREIESLERFVPLAEAIADGRVIQRRWVTPSTGAEHSLATIITLADGSLWQGERSNAAIARLIDRDACLTVTHTFPAYHRT